MMFPRSILLKTVCHNSTSWMRPWGIRHVPIRTTWPNGPGYASLAPPIHGRPNYQPLRPLPKQQLTSSSGFVPLKAPQPWFNSYHEASYPGYSQCLSAPSPFAYGNNNFQQQWQQICPTLKHTIGASWQHPPPLVQRQPKLGR